MSITNGGRVGKQSGDDIAAPFSFSVGYHRASIEDVIQQLRSSRSTSALFSRANSSELPILPWKAPKPVSTFGWVAAADVLRGALRL
jgi:hypothetical protein